MIDLAPCPFCGEKLVQHDDHHGTWWAHKNEAGSCWASVEQIHDDDDGKRWNSRPAQSSLTKDQIASILAPFISSDIYGVKCRAAADTMLAALARSAVTSTECGDGK